MSKGSYNYYGDPRTLAALTTRYYEVVSVHGGLALCQLTDRGLEWLADDAEYRGEAPWWGEGAGAGAFVGRVARETCDLCDGRGTHVDPRIDCGGLSDGDFDEDFEEAYYGGAYDVVCAQCRGTGHSQQVEPTDARLAESIRRMAEDAEDAAYERAQELRYGY